MKREIALFFLGLLAGAVLMYGFQGKRLEELYWEKENLKVQLYENAQQLKIIQEQQESLLPPVVQEIKLEINPGQNSFVEPELRQDIYNLAQGLLGQEIRALPYPLVYNFLEGRIVQSGEKKYRLEVKAVILSETLVYYLTAEQLTENGTLNGS